MVRTGDWVTPFWNGSVFFDKPPLVLWFMAGALKLVEPPELAVRLVPALAGLLTIGLTAWLGTAMLGRWAGAVAALLLLVGSSSQRTFVGLARHGMLDAPLTAATLWAVLHLWFGLQNHRHWYWLGVPLGLAVMIRSFSAAPIVLLLLLSALLWYWSGQPIGLRHRRSLAGGLLLAAAIALPWHLIELWRYGAQFWHDYGLIHLLKGRAAQDGNAGDWRFYFGVLRVGLPRWWWLAWPALALVAWHAAYRRDPRALLLLAWAVVPFGMYTLAVTKLPWYILPMYPALAIMVAWLLWDVLSPVPSLKGVALAGLLFFAAAWNYRSITPDDRSGAAKAVGACANRLAAADQPIGFFDPVAAGHPPPIRPSFNIKPAVRFYADRPMRALKSRMEVEQWLAEGQRLVWTDTASGRRIADLFMVAAEAGDQQLLRRVDRGAIPWPQEGCHAP